MSIPIFQGITLVEKKLPVFIVGAGGIVRDAHLPAYRKAGFTVTGICDLQLNRAEALRTDFPEIENVYPSLDAFVKARGNESIVYDVAVPANAIMPVLEKLPEGAAVLIQKPMGETLKEAQAIMEICELKSFAAAVNFQLPYAPFSLVAKNLIAHRLLGDIYDIEMMVCVNTPWHLWDFLKEKSRVEILYHSIHYIDLVRSFLGNPVRIHASTIRHPRMRELASTRTTVILDYDEFTQARIITNHGHLFGPDEQQSYLKIEGMKGAIKIRIGVSLNYPAGAPDRFLLTCPETGGLWAEVQLNGSWFPDAFMGTMNHVQQLAAKSGPDRLATLRDNLETMRLVEAAYRSSESGGILLSDVQ